MATGDGRFIHRVDASRIIVISSSEPIDNLETLLQAAQVDSDPVNALEKHVLAQHPLADVQISLQFRFNNMRVTPLNIIKRVHPIEKGCG